MAARPVACEDGVGFQAGVFRKGRPRLVDVDLNAQVPLEQQLHAIGREDRLQLPLLMDILACQDKFHTCFSPPRAHSSAWTKSALWKGIRSSICSPTPMSLTGICSVSATAMTMPPLAVPSSFVRTMPVTSGDLAELLGLEQAVLAGRAVQDEQRLRGWRPGSSRSMILADLLQLVHQILLVVQPPGGIAEDHVAMPRALAAQMAS